MTPTYKRYQSGAVQEHIQRARTVLTIAGRARTFDEAFALVISAIYPARAAMELMREAAKCGDLKLDLNTFDRWLGRRVPLYRLVHNLRIVDFHQRPLSATRMEVVFRVRVPAYGRAEFSLWPNPTNPRPSASVSNGSGNFEFFLTSPFVAQDEREPAPLAYDVLLVNYLNQLDAALPAYAAMFL